MGLEYLRPNSLEDLRKILSNNKSRVVPLYGMLDKSQLIDGDALLVDLQDVGLNFIEPDNNGIQMGGGLLIKKFLDFFSSNPILSDLVRREFNNNQRNQVCIAGVITQADARSSLLTALLAYDARVEFLEFPDKLVSLGDYLSLRNGDSRIITRIVMSYDNTILGFEAVRRSPADLPVVIVAAVTWRSGRIRMSLGGYGDSPIMVYDGYGTSGMELAASDAYANAGDMRASGEYRSSIAGVLGKRVALSI